MSINIISINFVNTEGRFFNPNGQVLRRTHPLGLENVQIFCDTYESGTC